MTKNSLSHDALWPRAGDWPAPQADSHADLTIVGVPTWRTSLSPTNAGLTPAAIRDAIRRYTIDEGLTICDAGDIYEPDLEEESATQQITTLARATRLLVALGGDNALTVPVALGGYANDIKTAGLVTLDAHHDLREGRSNGSPIRRLIEAGLNPKRIVQIGIADFANSQIYRQRASELGITVIHRNELHTRKMADVMAEALAVASAGGGPVHVDIDVDVCDRAVAPGCPASIPGGISAYEIRQATRIAASHARVRTIDIAEVDATADAPDQRTVRLAALLVLEAAEGLRARKDV